MVHASQSSLMSHIWLPPQTFKYKMGEKTYKGLHGTWGGSSLALN